MLAVLAIPRIARILYPEVWIEDDFYLESAYLVSAGMRPYVDFVHPHMPLLEWIAAGYIRIFGAGHLSLECLNEAAIYLTSILTFALARKVAGYRAAICAAILYAFSALVFRYHVYERESFTGAIATGAAILALREDFSLPRQAGWQAALWIAACAIKLTSVIPAAVVLGYLAIGRRRILEAAIAGAGIALGLSILSAILYWRYGFEFVFQTFIFHFMKGRDLQTNLALYPREILDLMIPLFALGLIRLGLARQFSRAGVFSGARVFSGAG
ncbi:MAG TPA: glycosyltransferase family 39 protein, partial [Pseudomonadota bacterium]|nr:glycosyltransferase family 39 protein [Pseudomonadota bacterium]